jgi:tetratricopeptide (TPR) repeat protein
MPDDFMMTAEEIRLRNLKRRRLFFAAIALMLFLTAGFFGGRPTLNAVKSWQARRHATNAFAAIQKEDWIGARNEAIAAYQLRSTEPQAIRAVARFLSRTRQADALEFWQQLEKVAPLTREDRQDEAAIAIAAGETSRAEIAVNALLESQGADPAGWLLAAQLAIQKGVADDANSALQKIFSDARATEQQQLQAALLELTLASGNAQPDERASDAWSRIEKLSTGTSAIALDSLVLLARRALSGSTTQPLNNSTASDLPYKLASHPLARAPHKLLALDVRVAQGANRDQLIGEAITQWKDSDPNDQLALVTWLNSKNEFQKTLDAIPLEKALMSRELLLQNLDALGGLGRWKEIKQLLESERYPLDPVVQRMYLARCNAQLGEKTAAENNWQRALEAAGGDAGKLVSLGEYAEKNGIVDVARQAFDAAVTESPKLRIAHQGRSRIAQRSGDTKKIHAVLADMLKIWPNDAAVQNDEAYTRLLLMQQTRVNGYSLSENGKNPKAEEPNAEQTEAERRKEKGENDKGQSGSDLDQIVELAANLVVKNPRSMPHRTLLALAYLRGNRAADAVVVYKDITVTRNALTPSALAVHAAVLAANGENEDARTEAAQIKPEQLLPEERQLIATLKQN